MTEAELATTYRDYIACLNAQDWPRLGLYVAHANNELHEKELKALTALLGSDTMWNPPPPEKIKADLDVKLEEAKTTATKLSRTQLVQHLTIVAAADGVVEPVELEAMYHVAGKLEVPPIVIDETRPPGIRVPAGIAKQHWARLPGGRPDAAFLDIVAKVRSANLNTEGTNTET